MQDDSIKTLSPLLPKPPSLGNDENESENKRNSRPTKGAKFLKRQQRKQSSSSPKNFMESSKSLNPKKKILEEWKQKKPSILGPKSVGTSASISSLVSPSKVLDSSDFDDNSNENDDDDTFVPDPSMPRYDPVTNYLSPRPKYLRYNPNRRREINLRKEKYGIDNISISPSVSVESQTQSSAVYYSTAESCYKENGHSEVEQLMGEDEEEEEEVIEVRKWGLKWELLKVVIVFGVLVLSTMYISSVDSSVPLSLVARRRLEIEYHSHGNRTFGVDSLRSVAFGNWVFVESGEYEMGMFELDESVVQLEGISRESDAYEEDQEIEISENIDHGQIIVKFDTEDDFKPVMESLKDGDVENKVLIIHAEVPDKETEEEYVVVDSMSNDELVEDEAQMVGLELIEVIEEEILANFDEKTNDSEGEIVVEQENVDDHEMGKVGIEPKSKDGLCEKELVMVAEDQNDSIVTKEENMVDSEKEMIEYELKSMDDKLENVAEIVTEDPIVEVFGHNQVWLNLKNVVWFVISSVMTLVTSLVVRFYFKCKKASSKTIPSNVKLCCQPEIAEKNSLKLPPKAGVKNEQIQKLQSHSNPTPVIEMTPRFIPRVEVLSEFAIGEDFRNSLKSCTPMSQTNVQECKENNDSARAPSSSEPSASEFSMADFLSYETNKHEEKTTTKEDGKEMTKVTPTPLRRSSRLRNRGVTSP